MMSTLTFSWAIAPDVAGDRPKGRLNRTDRDYLVRSARVLRFWAQREGLAYVEKV